ncbi:MAG: YdcF family protein [Acidobacteria bacterium]|nr:YdcF family protein [Acidobacteriota bacterium]
MLRVNWRRAARGAVTALAAWALVAWGAARWLAVAEALPRADAVVVLGGAAAYVERTREAARLYGEGRAPVVVLTNDGLRGGWSQAQQRNPFFHERAGEELRRAGVAAQRIELVPGVVASTHDEAVAVRAYAAARGWRSLLVVTSAYHSRRALWTFRRVFEGSNVALGLAPAPPGEGTPSTFAWWLRPRGWRLIAGEYLKLIYYRWQYG